MAVLIALELFTLWLSIQALSSVRALVGAEGLYSKAQKNATYKLQKYYYFHEEADYEAFLNFMNVPLGDHQTRLALTQKKPDIQKARDGFLAGRSDEGDVDGMIRLLLKFHNISYIKNAIRVDQR